jgi:hypothetical protein
MSSILEQGSRRDGRYAFMLIAARNRQATRRTSRTAPTSIRCRRSTRGSVT